MAKKTPGIYIAIRGDVSAFETDLNHARQIAKAQGEAIAQSIGNVVSKADLSGGINKLTRELKTAQAALSAGAFKAQVTGLDESAKAAGVSSKHLEGLTNSMLKSQAAATANRAFEYLQKNAGLSTQNQLDYVYDVTQRLGLQFQGTAEAAKGFFAAGKDSVLKEHLNGIFKSVSMAGSALALSKDQMDGVFLALGQMISKGKVQAEELRGQLGERLPGAFDMAARAMGVTTAKLDDMLKKGQVTAEEMLPKLAKVLHDDFAVAAAEASQGLQGQLNRLSTEWTRFQASLLDGDAAAKVLRQLASGMKVLADHGAEIAAIVGKGLQWAAWAAGVYTLIKAVSGLSAAFAALKAVGAAASLATVAAAAVPIALVVGAAAVAFTSLSHSAQSADDIFRKHQATIDAYKEKLGKATEQVKSFTAEQEEAYRKSLERQSQNLKADIADAVADINSELSKIQLLPLDIMFNEKGTLFAQARSEVAELGRELAKLGSRITPHDLDSYKERILAIHDRMVANGLATKEWREMIDALVGEGDSFVLKIAAMIVKGQDFDATLEKLKQSAANAKHELATGWIIGLDGVDNALGKLDERLRKAQAKISNVKGMADAAATFKDFSIEQLETLKNALDTGGRGALIKKLGEEYHVTAGQIQEVSGAMTKYFARLKVTTAAEEKAAKMEDERRKKYSGKASIIEQTSTKLEALRKEVAALEEANIPAAKSFDQIVAKLDLERKNAVAAAEEHAKLAVQRKQATAAQAAEQKALEIRKAELVYTQKLRGAEAKRDDDRKKQADIRLDFEKRYADMVGLSSEAVSKSISKQAEEYRKAIEAGENAAEELVRLEEWKRDQMQRASREAMDGAQVALRDYQVEASNQAKSMNEAFKGLFDGMDSGWKSAWQQMIETGKVSLSSFRSLFASFLADLLHMAITRPITVQIAGVVSGMFGAGGVAQAAGGAGGSGGAGGLLGNIPFSSLLPDSITGGISGLLGTTLPGTTAVLTTPGAYTAGEILLMQGGGATAGTVGGQAALVSGGLSLGSALTYGGFGSLGYSLLGGALGLPQSKYSGLTAGVGGALGAWGGSALGSAAGIAAGSALGSVVPIVGTAIGALAGGLVGSMFGKTKTHPSVYTNVPEASLVGTDWAKAFKQGAWGHRMNAGEIDSFFDEIGGYANSTAQTLLSFAQSLPEAYASGVTENLKKQTVGMGRGTTAGRGWVGNRGPSAWDLQFYDDEHTERAYRTTQQDIARVMLQGLAKSMEAAGTSIRDIFPHLNLRASNADLGESDEWTKAVSGLSAIQGIQDAIKGIDGAQMTQAEQQAKAFVEQLEALSSAVASYGVDKGYADKLVEEYRAAYVDSYVKSLEEMFHPLSQVEQQARGYKEAIDGYVKALETMQASEAQLAKVRGYTQTAIDNIISALESSLSPLSAYEQAQQNANAVIDQHIAALRQLGASEGEIARVEALRAEAVAQATAELLRSFEQGVAQRWAALDGTSDEVGRAISQENELREAVLKFGEGSAQVAELLKLHAAETAKAAEEAAKAAQEAVKSEYETLKSQFDALNQQRVQLQQQAIHEEISALNEQLSAMKTLKSTWEGLDKSLGQARYNLFAGTANLDAENRLGTVQAEFRRLSGLAMGGDSEAAGQLAGVGNSLLDLVKQTAGTEEEYLDAFWAVNAQLRNAQDVAGAQVSSADKQLEALQGQLDVQNAALEALQGQSATLEEIEKQITALRPVLEAAADKAGIKAFASGGLAVPGWALVGEKGPELVNFSQPGRVYTAADTAALFRSATPRAADAGSREEVKALREEVYQLRRDMNLLLNEIAKYGRRTSDTVEAWDAEGMPGVRA